MVNKDTNYIIDELNKEKCIDELFEYWRKEGFPAHNKDEYDYKKELSNLIMFDERTILQGTDLKQTMHGCGFLWTYFPHWNTVRCGGDKKSVLEHWNDDKELYTLIRKTVDYEIKHNKGIFTINRLRQNAKVYCSKQSVSNFRPSVAKYIYNTYGNKGVVWDMSSGFGGRLLGFLASDCKKYIGTDPSTPTYNGLLEMKKDYEYVGKDIELLCQGSETYVPEENSLDLCFTSPPYFDTEKYTDEETQSYKKFPKTDLWLDGFLKKTIENCYIGLKDDGYLIINIANTKSYKTVEDDLLRVADEVGFECTNLLYLTLSSISGKGIKREPTFIFQKKNRDKNCASRKPSTYEIKNNNDSNFGGLW